jgi:hypothetical protein
MLGEGPAPWLENGQAPAAGHLGQGKVVSALGSAQQPERLSGNTIFQNHDQGPQQPGSLRRAIGACVSSSSQHGGISLGQSPKSAHISAVKSPPSGNRGFIS